jgi:cytochrome b561
MSPLSIQLHNWHKWLGIAILAGSAVRLAWRITYARPVAHATGKPWSSRARTAVHRLMYVLFFLVPLTGWARSSAMGFPVKLFGLVSLPDLVPVNRELGRLVLAPVHRWSAYGLAGLAALHIGVALKRHFVDRDGRLETMLPRQARREQS